MRSGQPGTLFVALPPSRAGHRPGTAVAYAQAAIGVDESAAAMKLGGSPLREWLTPASLAQKQDGHRHGVVCGEKASASASNMGYRVDIHRHTDDRSTKELVSIALIS